MMPNRRGRTVSSNHTDSVSQNVFLFNKIGPTHHGHSNCWLLYILTFNLIGLRVSIKVSYAVRARASYDNVGEQSSFMYRNA